MQERLQKILARAGLASRRGAEQLMLEGRVTVNGDIVRELGAKADVETDDVRVDGVRAKAPRAHVYIVLNKPRGVVTTRSDPEGRPTVMSLVPALAGLFPVGRLDVTTEGLILLTNDGAFAERVSHPRYEVPRVYHAKVTGVPDDDALDRLRRGVRVDADLMAVDRVRVLEADNNAWVEVTLHEGKQHEVRRLLEAVGHPVSKLRRVAFGPVTTKGLEPGQFRALTPEEVDGLRKGLGARVSPSRFAVRRGPRPRPTPSREHDHGGRADRGVDGERRGYDREQRGHDREQRGHEGGWRGDRPAAAKGGQRRPFAGSGDRPPVGQRRPFAAKGSQSPFAGKGGQRPFAGSGDRPPFGQRRSFAAKGSQRPFAGKGGRPPFDKQGGRKFEADRDRASEGSDESRLQNPGRRSDQGQERSGPRLPRRFEGDRDRRPGWSEERSGESREGRSEGRRSGSAGEVPRPADEGRGARPKRFDGDRGEGPFGRRTSFVKRGAASRQFDSRGGEFDKSGGKSFDKRGGSFDSRGGKSFDKRTGSFAARGGKSFDKTTGSFDSRGGKSLDKRGGSFDSRGGKSFAKRGGSFDSRGGKSFDKRSGSFGARGGKGGSFGARGASSGARRGGKPPAGPRRGGGR